MNNVGICIFTNYCEFIIVYEFHNSFIVHCPFFIINFEKWAPFQGPYKKECLYLNLGRNWYFMR